MAKWKKLNPETGNYEEIPNTSISGIELKNSVQMSGVRTKKSIIANAVKVYESTKVHTDGTLVHYPGLTTYEIHDVKKYDVLRFPAMASTAYGVISDGTNCLRDKMTGDYRDNYAWYEGTFIADKDYETLFIMTNEPPEGRVSCTWEYAVYKAWPSFIDQFIPVIADDERNNIKTLSSEKIYNTYGSDELKAKEILNGGVWIALGDSYTVYADSNFKAIAKKYGMIYHGCGVVSSTVCGDDTGNKGYRAFHYRMDDFIEAYTGEGQTIDDAVYTAEDVKLITFMGGANDGFGKDTWLGSPTSMNPYYLYGACNYMFKRLHENFPNARIICILQPANFSDTMDYTDDETAQVLGFKDLAELQSWDVYSFGQYKMETKEKAVMECAKRFGIHIVDCIFDWYSVVNPTQREKYWNTDKIHLSAAGSAALAEKLDREGILKIFG